MYIYIYICVCVCVCAYWVNPTNRPPPDTGNTVPQRANLDLYQIFVHSKAFLQ